MVWQTLRRKTEPSTGNEAEHLAHKNAKAKAVGLDLMTFKKRIKLSGLSALRGLGAFRGFRASRWREQRLAILAYHGLSLDDEHQWNPAMFLPAAEFERRLQLLQQQGYTVLPLDEAVERLYRQTLPKKSVVLTIDDGNYDFYVKAFPLLRRYGFPATVYLTTYYCEYNKPLFPHVCSYMMWKRRGEVAPAQGLADGITELDLRSAASRAAACRTVFRVAEEGGFSAERKNELAERLAGVLAIDYAELCRKRMLHRMNAAEIAEIAAAGIDVQLHTHRHRVPEDQTLFRREIEENRAWIAAHTGRVAQHFCYPSGVYKPQFLPWLSALDIASATTCIRGLASPESERLLLPRFLDGAHVSLVEFEGRLSGFPLA
jgi:peptidoglycan/xylan/chitin deacetylase (PgdA/CDA1 family)